MSNKANIPLPDGELDWIQLRQDLGPIAEVETTKEKLQRKIKENPLVPIGKGRRFRVPSPLGYINFLIFFF